MQCVGVLIRACLFAVHYMHVYYSEPQLHAQPPTTTTKPEVPADTSELDEAMKEIQASLDDLGEQHAPDASEEESDSEDEEEGGCGCWWN